MIPGDKIKIQILNEQVARMGDAMRHTIKRLEDKPDACLHLRKALLSYDPDWFKARIREAEDAIGLRYWKAMEVEWDKILKERKSSKPKEAREGK